MRKRARVVSIDPSSRFASRAASLMNDGLTVPYWGPMVIPTRFGAPSGASSRTPTAWIYMAAYDSKAQGKAFALTAVLDASPSKVCKNRLFEGDIAN